MIVMPGAPASLGGEGSLSPGAGSRRAREGSWSPHVEALSLGFAVVLAALGCTCGFERWPTRGARALFNLLLDVTEGAFVRRRSKAPPTGLQTGFPLDISVVRWHPFDSFIFKDEFLLESGTSPGRRGHRFLWLG